MVVLRVLVVLGERAGIGVEWLGRLRAVSDRVTLALVRQAVDATLVGGMFLRAVAPAPQPITPPMIEYAQVQPIAVEMDDVEMRRRISPLKHAFVPKIEKRMAEIVLPIGILGAIPLVIKVGGR